MKYYCNLISPLCLPCYGECLQVERLLRLSFVHRPTIEHILKYSRYSLFTVIHNYSVKNGFQSADLFYYDLLVEKQQLNC